MVKNLFKVLTLYYISMTHILKNRRKTDISKFLKIVKFEGLKIPKKMHQNNILCTKHVLYAYTVSYISLKVYKYYYRHKIPQIQAENH